jgi:hypothetical protein
MDISFKREGKIAVARLSAWEKYAVGEIDWRLNWKLRFQVSITPTQAGYGLGEPVALGSGRFGTNSQDVSVGIAGETVIINFVLPDCLRVLDGGAWGCSAGGAIPLPGGKHHCQALMYARARDVDSVLRRTPDGFEFCTSQLGRVTRIALLNWTSSTRRPVPDDADTSNAIPRMGPRLVRPVQRARDRRRRM